MNKIVDDLKYVIFEHPNEMRYETLGDYQNQNDVTRIKVYSKLNKIERLAVGIHELVEMVLLHLQGVTNEMIDEWDMEDTGGNYDPKMYSKDKRYKEAHKFAEIVERKIIETYGDNWKDYCKRTEKIKIKFTPKT